MSLLYQKNANFGIINETLILYLDKTVRKELAGINKGKSYKMYVYQDKLVLFPEGSPEESEEKPLLILQNTFKAINNTIVILLERSVKTMLHIEQKTKLILQVFSSKIVIQLEQSESNGQEEQKEVL